MRPYLLQLILIIYSTQLAAQWSGEYSGMLNGDNISMTLNQSGNTVTGKMKDSQQSYTLKGEINGNRMAADLIEESLGLTMALLAEKSGEKINCTLVVELFGETNKSEFTMTKAGSTKDVQTIKTTSNPSKIPFPTGAAWSTALVGNWTKHETYNSGNGSNFMGANFSQTMAFHADGSVSEGGSNANMSGSSYYGNSNGSGKGVLDNIAWYNIGNQLYVIVYDGQIWQSAHLGQWYVENSNLLITGTNGEKLLLTK